MVTVATLFGADSLQALETSKHVTRHRCIGCGSPVKADLMGGKAIALPLGAFDPETVQQPGWQPQHHLHYDRRVADVPDDLPKFAEAAGRALWAGGKGGAPPTPAASPAAATTSALSPATELPAVAAPQQEFTEQPSPPRACGGLGGGGRGPKGAAVLAENMPSSAVFVKNLDPATTDAALKDAFVGFMVEPDRNKLLIAAHYDRGFAFVDLGSAEACTRALGQGRGAGFRLGDRRLVVEPSKKPVRPSGLRALSGRKGASSGGPGDSNAAGGGESAGGDGQGPSPAGLRQGKSGKKGGKKPAQG